MRQANDNGLKGLEGTLINMWERVLTLDEISVEDNFFELGGNSIAAARFTNMLQERLGEAVQITVIYEMPTVASLAEYLADNYRDAVAGIGNQAGLGGQSVTPRSDEVITNLTEKDFAYARETVSALNRYSAAARLRRQNGGQRRKNPQAIFVLCTARSGSTLLRVMLGGHRMLFAPPELLLLPFETLRQRSRIFSGPRSLWSEGVIRAIMEIKHCDVEQAKEILAQCEEKDFTTQELYALMQEWLNGKRLIDKSPSYSQSVQVMQRAEDYFDNALYIHLLRHPVAMIASYERERIDQLSFRENLGYGSRQMAELLWVISHQNILEFLSAIPEERKHRVVYENLVKQPRSVMEGICEFFSLNFDEEMLDPYQNQDGKMTDGTQPSSRMLGDPNFHSHKSIDAGMAETWKKVDRPVALSEITWRLAEELGYERGK
jgi:acyl carrier protein